MTDQFAANPVKGAHSRGDVISTQDLLGVLAAIANAAPPAYAEGTEQGLSVDLAGNLRTLLAAGSTTALNVGGTAVSAGTPLPVGIEVAGAAVAPGNPVPVNLEQGGAVISAANAEFVQPGTGAQFVVKGTHSQNAAAPAADLVGVLAAIANAAAPAYTEGDGVLLSTDLAGNLRVAVAATGAMTVVGNKANNAASPDSLGLEVYPAVATAAGPAYTAGDLVSLSTDLAGRLRALIDGTSAPSLTANGGVVATANPLPVGLEVAGAAVAAGNPIPVVIEIGGTPDAPANPLPAVLVSRGVVRDSGQLTHAAVAAGANFTLAHPVSPTATGHLIEVTASASVRIKVEIQTLLSTASGTVTDLRTFIVDPIGDGLAYKTPSESAITLAAAAGAAFQVKITNLDNANAADVYASLTYLDY